MKVIGLTGGIGCGKTMVAKLLEERFHCPVLIADEIGRRGMERGTACYDRVREAFGKTVLREDNTLDREQLGKKVFKDKEALALLNSIVHPYVKQRILKELEILLSSGFRHAAIESAILLEAGYESLCDEIWYVYAPEELRRERLHTSRGYSREKADLIMGNQLSEEEFRMRCHRVIANHSTEEALIEQLEILLV